MRPEVNILEDKLTSPAPRRLRGWKIGCALGFLVVMALWRWPGKFAVAEVVSSRSNPPVAVDDGFGDFQLMVFARQALQQDDQLGTLNLGVTVRGRIATLWGGIPSEVLAHRAEERLRGMVGIAAVRNELRVETHGEVKKNLFALPANSFRGGETQVASSPLTPGSLTSFPGDQVPERRPGAMVEPAASKAPEAVTVMPPLVISFRPPPLPDPPPQENPGTASPARDLVAALDRLRTGESRFRQIQVDLQGGVVRLSGTVPEGGDMMAFAQLISRVAGVQRVIVGETRTPRKESLQLP